MVLGYLFVALFVGIVSAVIWLITGGAWGMAFVVYTMSGLLMIAAMASATYAKTREDR